jgi:hypothetical protein
MNDQAKASVFISYASERADLAADIAAALAVEGHEVFYDRESLTPAEPFGKRIRDAIARSNVFVILVTSEIFKDQSYVLSELKFAKQELRKRNQQILPVVILPVDYRKLDPYLRRLTALYPEGNAAAEVAARVNELVRGSSDVSALTLLPEVAEKQLEAYGILWRLTGILPKWGREETPTYSGLQKFGRDLREWYFAGAGGLFFTRASYSRYAELQNALETLDSDDPATEITTDDYEAIRRLCSSLRQQLADDLGTRR